MTANMNWKTLVSVINGITHITTTKDGYVFDSEGRSYKLNIDGRSAVLYGLNAKGEATDVLYRTNEANSIDLMGKSVQKAILMEEYLAPVKQICRQASNVKKENVAYTVETGDKRTGQIMIYGTRIKYTLRDEFGKIVTIAMVYDVPSARIDDITNLLGKHISYRNDISNCVVNQKIKQR